MSEGFESEYGFWRVVMEKGLSASEVDTWDLEDIDKANAYLDMAEDYKTAFHELYEDRSRRASEKT